MRSLSALAMLLAICAVNAQTQSSSDKPQIVGASPVEAVSQTAAISGRRLSMLQKAQTSRKLLGVDGPTVTPYTTDSATSFTTGSLCPASGNTPYSDAQDGQWSLQLISDRGICVRTTPGVGTVVTSGAGSGQVYGAAAQDFGSAKSGWETYGWALFSLAAPPNTEMNAANIQGVSLHILGNVGLKNGGSTCSIKGISIAIFPADQASPDKAPLAGPIHTKNITTPGVDQVTTTVGSTFSWTTNTSTIMYLDITDDPASPVQLNHTTYYWLRVKFFADYGGSSGTGQCFAFWGLSSTINTALTGASNTLGNAGYDLGRARWQEGAGQAAGYSTTCTGAYTSGTALPSRYQTFWNCWNNGVNTFSASPLRRRCSTYRTQIVPNLAVADCTASAQFNDFNFAFFGAQGQIAGGGGGGP